MRKVNIIFVKLCISAGLLVWLVGQSDWQTILLCFQQVPFWGLCLATGLYMAAQILSSIRWWMICKMLGVNARWPELLNLYFLGMFFNLFMPTAVGGDVIKSYQLGKSGQNHLNAAYTILFDRFSGLMALVWLAMLALFHIDIPLPWIRETLLIIGFLSIVCLVLLPQSIPTLSKLFPRLSEYLIPVLAVYQNKRLLSGLFVMALLIQLTGVLVVVILGYFLNIHLSPFYFLIAWSMITLATLIPISINGLGIREMGFVMFFQPFDIADEQAITLGVLTFIIPAISSVFGIIPFLKDRSKL